MYWNTEISHLRHFLIKPGSHISATSQTASQPALATLTLRNYSKLPFCKDTLDLSSLLPLFQFYDLLLQMMFLSIHLAKARCYIQGCTNASLHIWQARTIILSDNAIFFSIFHLGWQHLLQNSIHHTSNLQQYWDKNWCYTAVDRTETTAVS